jgi:hypothetical protein
MKPNRLDLRSFYSLLVLLVLVGAVVVDFKQNEKERFKIMT